MSIDMEKDYENDIPKHKKKSTAKGTPRAKHKHIYETGVVKIQRDVLGKFHTVFCRGSFCTMCGRVGNLDMLWCEPEESVKEMWEKYPHYIMNDFMDKFASKEEVVTEPDTTCPNCFHKAEYQATWGEDLMYSCPNCLCDWVAYKDEYGVVRITERFFFG